MKMNRSNGKKDDRSELSFLEKRLAYGYTVDKNFTPDMKKKVGLVAVPQMETYLNTDPKTQIPYLSTKINGKDCMLRKVYVASQESKWGLPKVDYIDIYGIDLNSKESHPEVVLKERITS